MVEMGALHPGLLHEGNEAYAVRLQEYTGPGGPIRSCQERRSSKRTRRAVLFALV